MLKQISQFPLQNQIQNTRTTPIGIHVRPKLGTVAGRQTVSQLRDMGGLFSQIHNGWRNLAENLGKGLVAKESLELSGAGSLGKDCGNRQGKIDVAVGGEGMEPVEERRVIEGWAKNSTSVDGRNKGYAPAGDGGWISKFMDGNGPSSTAGSWAGGGSGIPISESAGNWKEPIRPPRLLRPPLEFR